jgi:hypothetical protein
MTEELELSEVADVSTAVIDALPLTFSSKCIPRAAGDVSKDPTGCDKWCDAKLKSMASRHGICRLTRPAGEVWWFTAAEGDLRNSACAHLDGRVSCVVDRLSCVKEPSLVKAEPPRLIPNGDARPSRCRLQLAATLKVSGCRRGDFPAGAPWWFHISCPYTNRMAR